MTATVTAALWMLGTITSFSVMAVAGREVSHALDTFEIMMYRSVVGFVIVISIIVATGRWRDVRTQRLGTHLVRNVAHFIGQNLWFFAVAVIPLAQVFALEFTTFTRVMVSPRISGLRTMTQIGVVNSS
ncbi:MAG: EamA family transporter, partial [Pseudomonadota bacterium]